MSIKYRHISALVRYQRFVRQEYSCIQHRNRAKRESCFFEHNSVNSYDNAFAENLFYISKHNVYKRFIVACSVLAEQIYFYNNQLIELKQN